MAVATQLSDVELISVDSMQVYRGMDIGTAKPTKAEQAEVAHHGIDLVEPTELFTVADFKQAYASALRSIGRRGHRAVLVGGTGLYHRVVIDDFDLPGEWPEARASLESCTTDELTARLQELDPQAASKIDPQNRRRVLRALEVTVGSGRRFSSFGPGVDHYPPSPVAQVGLRWPRDVLAQRVEARVHAMIGAGLVDEVRSLAERGLSMTAAQALGYKELLAALEGETSVDEAIQQIVVRTRQFAVRQQRWFRRDPRVRWVDVDHDPAAEVAPVVIEELCADD